MMFQTEHFHRLRHRGIRIFCKVDQLGPATENSFAQLFGTHNHVIFLCIRQTAAVRYSTFSCHIHTNLYYTRISIKVNKIERKIFYKYRPGWLSIWVILPLRLCFTRYFVSKTAIQPRRAHNRSCTSDTTTNSTMNCSLNGPLRQPYGLPPLPRGEARRCSAPTWLPLWGSCHGLKAVTERVHQTTI